MKKRDIYEAMSLIDDKYIAESMTPYKAKIILQKLTRVAAFASCVLLVVGIVIAAYARGFGNVMSDDAMSADEGAAAPENDEGSNGSGGDSGDMSDGSAEGESSVSGYLTSVNLNGALLTFTVEGVPEVDAVILTSNGYYTAEIADSDAVADKIAGAHELVGYSNLGLLPYTALPATDADAYTTEYTVDLSEITSGTEIIAYYIYLNGLLVELEV